MKSLSLVLFVLAGVAHAEEAGRFLPRGENNPRTVTNVFNAPSGEVQILAAKTGELSALLRVPSGALATLQGISGPARCDEWLKNGAKGGAVNAACTLLFRKDSDGSEVTVDARDLESSSLFGMVKTTIKGRHGAL